MREYAVVMENATAGAITAPRTFVYISPANGYPFGIIRAWWSQGGTAVSAQQHVALRAHDSGSGTYTSVTPRKLSRSDPISKIVGGTNGAAGTAGINASVEPSGTIDPLYADVVNNLNGFLWTASPVEMLRFNWDIADAFTLALTSTLSTAGSNSAGAYFVELA